VTNEEIDRAARIFDEYGAVYVMNKSKPKLLLCVTAEDREVVEEFGKVLGTKAFRNSRANGEFAEKWRAQTENQRKIAKVVHLLWTSVSEEHHAKIRSAFDSVGGGLVV
jgi:hypothetical protein